MADVESVRDRARVAIARGDYDRASLVLETVLRLFPQDIEARALVGQIHLENQRQKMARDTFQAVLEVDPENLLARSSLAVLARDQGDLPGALEHFRRAFDLNTSNQQIAGEIKKIQSRLGRGRSDTLGSSQHAGARRLLREGKYDRAIPLFKSALRNAHDPEIAVGLIQATWLQRQWKEAEVAAREILVTRPRCLKAMVVLAGALHLKDDPQGRLLLKETGQLDPGNGVARRLFARVSVPYPEMEDAAEISEAELEGPSDALLRRERELLEFRSSLRADPASAPEVSAALQARVESDPGDLEARWLLGDSLTLQGQFRRAMEEYLVVLNSRRHAPGENGAASGN